MVDPAPSGTFIDFQRGHLQVCAKVHSLDYLTSEDTSVSRVRACTCVRACVRAQ
jgi:hypothetical protein